MNGRLGVCVSPVIDRRSVQDVPWLLLSHIRDMLQLYLDPKLNNQLRKWILIHFESFLGKKFTLLCHLIDFMFSLSSSTSSPFFLFILLYMLEFLQARYEH